MHYDKNWWVHVMEYNKEVKSLLGDSKSYITPTIEDRKTLLNKSEELTSLKAAWELMELFYANKQSQNWIPERILDWLADFDCLLSATQPTVHAKLVSFQKGLVTIQSVENDPAYWEVMSSALAVGWLNSWLGSYVLSLNSSIRATPVKILMLCAKNGPISFKNMHVDVIGDDVGDINWNDDDDFWIFG